MRECLEETGIQCHDVRPLLAFHSGVDTWLNFTHLYLSEHCEEKAPGSERRVFVPLDECMDMLFSGRIIDMLSITAILALHAERTRKRSHG